MPANRRTIGLSLNSTATPNQIAVSLLFDLRREVFQAMPTDQLNAILNTNNQPVPLQNALFGGDELRSVNGTFQLVLQLTDGNLVLYIDDAGGNPGNPNAGMIDGPIWSAGTQNRAAGFAVMQDDGNFVVYDSFENWLWASHTQGNSGAFVILQDDGNLVVYASDGITPLWQSRTAASEAPGNNT
jgi:hypothetical protein